jgi:oligopeptide transport system substrate-binding protein
VLAIDREKLCDEAFQGFVRPATGGYVPPVIPGHSPHIGLPYDPEGARRLLAAAGYPHGQGFPPVALLLGLEATARLILPFLREMWERTLGIAIQEQWQGADTLSHHPNDRQDYHFFLGSWVADYPDPDSFLRANFYFRHSRWRHTSFEALIEESRQMLDQGRRLELYRQADRILIEEAVIAPLYYGQHYHLRKPWVRKHTGSLVYPPFWKDITLDSH